LRFFLFWLRFFPKTCPAFPLRRPPLPP
jgi:hypothetical protein